MQPSIWNLPLLLLLSLLAGCVPSPQTRPDLQEPAYDPLVEQAEGFASNGDYRAAASLFEQLAAGKAYPENQRLLLRAAESYFQAADPDSAAALLAQLNLSELPLYNFQRRLLQAEMEVARNRPDEALKQLAAPPPERARIDTLRRYHRDRSEAFRLSGNLLESGRELEQRDLLTSNPTDKLENQLEILRTYAALNEAALRQAQPPATANQDGWMELTHIIKALGNDEVQINQQFASWRKKYPSHPAMPELLDGYFRELKGQYRKPEHLAIMLPESGPYARVASWLRDGLLAAYYNELAESRPRLVFYDSSSPEHIWPLYQGAVESGADMVIGPLDKESVAQLNRAHELEVPVLALNQVTPEGPPSADLYQFALSPEDETLQVADRAWTDGFNTAVMLTPAGDWGERIAATFSRRWEELGGILLERQSYNEEAHDFSAPIRSLLNIDQSIQRHKRLEQLLGRRLEFEPRRRHDTGFIFLAAKYQKARQIRPQLLFHHAEGVPIYTTSHTFSGVISAAEDQDLNGIRFPVIPWLIATPETSDRLSLQQLLQIFPGAPPQYLPLLAMGIDSMHLLPQLARLHRSPREIMEGKTGNIYMDSSNHLRRQMLWAEMVNGVPRIIGFSPRLDSEIGAFPEAPLADPNRLPQNPAPSVIPAENSARKI